MIWQMLSLRSLHSAAQLRQSSTPLLTEAHSLATLPHITHFLFSGSSRILEKRASHSSLLTVCTVSIVIIDCVLTVQVIING